MSNEDHSTHEYTIRGTEVALIGCNNAEVEEYVYSVARERARLIDSLSRVVNLWDDAPSEHDVYMKLGRLVFDIRAALAQVSK